MSDPRVHINRDWDKTVCPPSDGSPPVDTNWHQVEEVTDCPARLNDFPAADYEIEPVTQTECHERIQEYIDSGMFEVEQVNGGPCEECACCPCPCCKGKGFWSAYTLTASGFANDGVNPCNRCVELNGTFTLHHRGGCQWSTDELSQMPDCGGGEGPIWALSCSGLEAGGPWGASTQELGCGTGLYDNFVDDLCECGGTLTLNPVNVLSCLSCSAWAGSITIAPAGEWVSCGKPEPDCEAMMAARAAETPDQRASRIAAVLAARQAANVGVGSEMEKVIGELGWKATGCAGCKIMAQKMNRWGVEGCETHREEILGWLRYQQSQAGWLEKMRAGVLAVKTGLVTRLNPLDPAPGLLDESIRRFRET